MAEHVTVGQTGAPLKPLDGGPRGVALTAPGFVVWLFLVFAVVSFAPDTSVSLRDHAQHLGTSVTAQIESVCDITKFPDVGSAWNSEDWSPSNKNRHERQMKERTEAIEPNKTTNE